MSTKRLRENVCIDMPGIRFLTYRRSLRSSCTRFRPLCSDGLLDVFVAGMKVGYVG